MITRHDRTTGKWCPLVMQSGQPEMDVRCQGARCMAWVRLDQQGFGFCGMVPAEARYHKKAAHYRESADVDRPSREAP